VKEILKMLQLVEVLAEELQEAPEVEELPEAEELPEVDTENKVVRNLNMSLDTMIEKKEKKESINQRPEAEVDIENKVVNPNTNLKITNLKLTKGKKENISLELPEAVEEEMVVVDLDVLVVVDSAKMNAHKNLENIDHSLVWKITQKHLETLKKLIKPPMKS